MVNIRVLNWNLSGACKPHVGIDIATYDKGFRSDILHSLLLYRRDYTPCETWIAVAKS